jgi:hypothetical protein
MSDVTVVPNTSTLTPLHSAMTHDPLTGFRARHDCPDGGQWIGAPRPSEFEAWGDAASHEAACRHRQHRTVPARLPRVTARGGYYNIPAGEPCE